MNLKKRILIVDDDEAILQMIRLMLSPKRCEWYMEFVQSGPYALKKMKESPFDAVVSDVQMPAMSGVEFLNEVKSKYPCTVRILHSAGAKGELLIKSIECSHQYLRKPWSINELRQILEAAFFFQDLLQNENLRDLISKMGSLPSISANLIQLMEEIGCEEPNLDKIATIISSDIALTANILKFANSAYLGIRVPVTELSQAVRFLGLNNIRAIAFAHEIFSKLSVAQVPGLNVHNLQAHSTAVAGFARAVARMERQTEKVASSSMTAGMLHDIGKLILAMRMPDVYKQVVQEVNDSKESLCKKEQLMIGATHAEVGAYLLGIWGLPKSIVEAVAFHHQPSKVSETGFGPLTAVYAADQIWHELYDEEQDENVLQDEISGGVERDRLEAWKACCLNLMDE